MRVLDSAHERAQGTRRKDVHVAHSDVAKPNRRDPKSRRVPPRTTWRRYSANGAGEAEQVEMRKDTCHSYRGRDDGFPSGTELAGASRSKFIPLRA